MGTYTIPWIVLRNDLIFPEQKKKSDKATPTDHRRTPLVTLQKGNRTLCLIAEACKFIVCEQAISSQQ